MAEIKEAARTKVQFVLNDDSKGEFDVTEVTSVEIRGATGVATYRIDPLQDTLIKLVVTGRVVPEPVVVKQDNPEPAVESVVGILGTPENVKAAKDAEVQAEKDARVEVKPEADEKVSARR